MQFSACFKVMSHRDQICDAIWEDPPHVAQGNFAEIKKSKLVMCFFISYHLWGKSRNRRTFSKIENLRFLQNYDDYSCIFGIKIKGPIVIFHLKGHAVKLKCGNSKIF